MPSPHTIRNNQALKSTSGSTEKSCKSVKSKEKLAKDMSVNSSAGIESAKQAQTSSAEQPKSVVPSKLDEWDGKSSMSTKISNSFRFGQNSESVKLKLKTSDPKSITNDHGSVFSSSVQNDDSALALVMHTARDTEVKRDETEIFVPGKGELRSTQPDQP